LSLNVIGDLHSIHSKRLTPCETGFHTAGQNLAPSLNSLLQLSHHVVDPASRSVEVGGFDLRVLVATGGGGRIETMVLIA